MIKDQKLKILEIGIADGKSLLMWSDYFKNSTIIGIDIHKIDIEEKKDFAKKLSGITERE